MDEQVEILVGSLHGKSPRPSNHGSDFFDGPKSGRSNSVGQFNFCLAWFKFCLTVQILLMVQILFNDSNSVSMVQILLMQVMFCLKLFKHL